MDFCYSLLNTLNESIEEGFHSYIQSVSEWLRIFSDSISLNSFSSLADYIEEMKKQSETKYGFTWINGNQFDALTVRWIESVLLSIIKREHPIEYEKIAERLYLTDGLSQYIHFTLVPELQNRIMKMNPKLLLRIGA